MAMLQRPLAGFAQAEAPDLSNKNVQERLSPAAIPAFFKLAASWKLRDEPARLLLGDMSNGAFYQLKGGHTKPLHQDTLTPISFFLAVFMSLAILSTPNLPD